jgi:hypothetical protein
VGGWVLGGGGGGSSSAWTRLVGLVVGGVKEGRRKERETPN